MTIITREVQQQMSPAEALDRLLAGNVNELRAELGLPPRRRLFSQWWHTTDEVLGLGPLQELLDDDSVSEIMVVDSDHIYIENNGVLENSGRRFVSDAVTQAIDIGRSLAPTPPNERQMPSRAMRRPWRRRRSTPQRS